VLPTSGRSTEPSAAATDRWIDLDGADNARDLGGLPTSNGGRIRRHALIRSGTLQDLTRDAVSLLVHEIGVRTVIDLRLVEEAAREGSALTDAASVTYLALPLWTHQPPAPREHAPDADRAEVIEGGRSVDIVDHYVGYLEATDTVVAAARAMANPDRLPLVFHCAAGKDRTGVLAAIVLDAVGVKRDAIVADYGLTAERLVRIRDHLLRLETYREMRAVRNNTRGAMSADPESMRRLLAILDDRFDGGAGFLKHCGLNDAELDALRAALVEY
jgi:protein tyrosine/serine phosphatase